MPFINTSLPFMIRQPLFNNAIKGGYNTEPPVKHYKEDVKEIKVKKEKYIKFINDEEKGNV